MVAADGATQPSYERYRRGGNIELVFENVRRIADVKQRLGKKRPYLRWQYLTFEHNLHEIERAISIAPKLGFDCFNLATPYDVSSDEPSVRAVEYTGPDSRKSIVFAPDPGLEFVGSLESQAERIHSLLHEDLEARFLEHAASREHTSAAARGSSMCDWLHLGVVVDAAGRVGSCCISDFKGAGRIYLGSLGEDGNNVYNSRLFMAARTLMAQPEKYSRDVVDLSREERPFCEGCTARPLPQVGLGAASWYLRGAQALAGAPSAVLEALTSWSEHDSNVASSPASPDGTEPVVPSISFWGELGAESTSLLPRDFANPGIDSETFRSRYITSSGMPDGCSKSVNVQGHHDAFLGRHETRDLRGDARVIDILLVQNDKIATNFVSPNASLRVIVKVHFDRALPGAIVGLTLSDPSQRTIVATNSSRASRALSPVDAGATKFYQFDLSLGGAGKYMFMEAAIAASVVEICDRRTSVLGLVVED